MTKQFHQPPQEKESPSDLGLPIQEDSGVVADLDSLCHEIIIDCIKGG